MAWPDKVITEIGRLIRFGLTGMITTLVYVVTAFVIVEMGVAGPMVATIISYCIAAIFSYFAHLHYSFRVRPDHRIYLWRFSFTVAITFSMTVGFTWLITEFWLGPFYVALIVIIMILPAISYACSRFWVYLPGLKE